jgi:hypothetical protein
MNNTMIVQRFVVMMDSSKPVETNFHQKRASTQSFKKEEKEEMKEEEVVVVVTASTAAVLPQATK